jgi:methanogenic corrinoid protein MtbC1
MEMRDAVKSFRDALLTLDRFAAQRILHEVIDSIGILPSLDELITTSLEDIGSSWENGEIALSQIYMSGRICEELIDLHLPAEGPGREHEPRMAIAVFEDYHMLGKRVVHAILRSAGYELIDYERVDIESVLRRVEHDRVQILFLSVLMLPSALLIAELRRRFDHAGLPVKIVVGGAPFRFDQGLWREVGADAMGRTASDAVAILRQLKGARP